MSMLVVDNEHPKNMCYDNIRLYAQIAQLDDSNLDCQHNQEGLGDQSKHAKFFTLTS